MRKTPHLVETLLKTSNTPQKKENANSLARGNSWNPEFTPNVRIPSTPEQPKKTNPSLHKRKLAQGRGNKEKKTAFRPTRATTFACTSYYFLSYKSGTGHDTFSLNKEKKCFSKTRL